MTCEDCFHYSCRKHWYDGFEDFDSRFNDTNVEILCPEFKDKSKIIELPCKVGDTVYYLGGHYERHKTKVYVYGVIKGIVDHITIGQKGVPQIDVCDDENTWTTFDSVDDFGKIVFLTREALEKKLEELKKCQ